MIRIFVLSYYLLQKLWSLTISSSGIRLFSCLILGYEDVLFAYGASVL